ncbi:RDD family protein [Pontiellaceae bacterium B1224]|nr:RDD family protein [Pontiellaceae bacterium B1224]
MEPKKLYYAAWWRRFLAFWIDFLVFIPLMVFQTKAMQSSPRLFAAILIPVGFIMTGYWIYCHGRWGKTIGKKLTGTYVATLDGNHISWKQAFLRSSVDIVFVIIASIALLPIYLTIPVEGYAELSPRDRFELIKSSWPAWYPFCNNAQQIWIWSEFIVILTNKRRRALHDYIAGTVVLQNKPSRRQSREEDPHRIDTSKEMKKMKL